MEQELKELCKDAYEISDRIRDLLKPHEKLISQVCHKPLAEMGIGERIKLAQFILELRRDNHNKATR